MTDLTAIAAAVQAMLETVDGFQLVEHSSARRAPEYVPSAVHYFAGAGEADTAALDQVLSWGINLYAPVMDASEGNQHALELIEAVGAAVDDWAPTISGQCLPAVLAEARITEVTDTLLTYYLELRLSVPAAATANTATGDSLLNAIIAELGDHDPVAQLVSDVPAFIVYDHQDLSTLFQNAAGTLPVYRPGTGLVDPPVGLMLDKSQGLELGPELAGNLVIAPASTPGYASFDSTLNRWEIKRDAGGQGGLSFDPQVTVGKGYLVVLKKFAHRELPGANPAITFYRVFNGSLTLLDSVGEGAEFSRLIIPDNTVVPGVMSISNPSVGNAVGLEFISVREIKGYHAYQTTPLNRPLLSGRYNLLLATTTLSTQSVTTAATNYTLSFSGAGTVTLSGTATGTYSAGTHTITCTAGTLTCTVAGSVTKADLRRAGTSWQALPAYQRVDSATSYDAAGFPLYIKPDQNNDQIALTIPAGGVAGSLLVSGVDGATITDGTLAEGTYLYPPDPTTGPDHIRQWVLFGRGLTAGERAAVEMWVEYGVQVALSTYLCPEAGYRPACVGVPSLGIRPAGVTREEISGCSYDARYQVELIAHVEADGSTSAASVLDAASAVLINNLLGLPGVGACRPMDDGTPGLVRDEYGRWLVRASRMLEYTISERY